MRLPPALQAHIDKLREESLTIETIQGDEIGVVIKDYPLPAEIWSQPSADLLIKTHPTYPNAMIDMFWLDPPVSLRCDAPVNAATIEAQFGREWQRFSWHVGTWDPAHDNLLTYLTVVDDRLSRNE